MTGGLGFWKGTQRTVNPHNDALAMVCLPQTQKIPHPGLEGGLNQIRGNNLVHPLCMEEFTPGLVGAFVGVGTKVIPLGLGEILG